MSSELVSTVSDVVRTVLAALTWLAARKAAALKNETLPRRDGEDGIRARAERSGGNGAEHRAPGSVVTIRGDERRRAAPRKRGRIRTVFRSGKQNGAGDAQAAREGARDSRSRASPPSCRRCGTRFALHGEMETL